MPDEVPGGTTLADATIAPEPSALPAPSPSERSASEPSAKPATVAPGALSALLAELVGAPEAASPEPTPGTVIGRFELLRRLGAGGFGVVWEARDRQLGRKVAFKLIRPGDRAELREESLLREAEAAARLSHDNIVALHDVGRSEHGPFLVLELLRGQTLAERLAAGTPTPTDAVRIVRDVTRGVAHAHAGGVVHRDLKPANVFLCDDGRVKVLDFGLAHAFGRRRQSGGTPAYMAPEQWKDAPEDERTDVFALGVILYQALSGALPFADEKATISRQPAPSLELTAAPELGPLVTRMLEKDPLKRPRDAGEVLAALDGCLAALGAAGAGAGTASSGTATMVRTRRHPRWRITGFIAAGLAVGIALALGATALRSRTTSVNGKLLIAVADIVNETGEKELDVLSGLLVTSLEQSRKLEVMTQARVLDLAAQSGRKGATRVDETIGRAVALEARAAALLLPAILKLGATYAVELRAIDPVKDQHLFTVSDRASSREGLFDLLDRLSEKARMELKEDPAEFEKSRIQLGTAMTRSVEAYQHYLAGVEARHFGGGLRAVALREQLRAIELDPQFAAAHAHLAWTYEVYGRKDLASPHWEAADRYLDRMPEKERTLLLLFRARGSTGKPDAAEAKRLADALLERWPQDKYVVGVALLDFPAGQFSGLQRFDRARLAKAEPALRRALALDPGGPAATPLVELVGVESAEALVVAQSAVAARPGGNLLLLGTVLAAHGRLEEAAAAGRKHLEQNGIQSVVNAGNGCSLLTELGDRAACLPYLRRIMAEGLNEFERDEARSSLVFRLMEVGQLREALQICGEGRCQMKLFLLSIGLDRHRPPPSVLAAVREHPDRAERRLWLGWFGDLAGAAREDAAMKPEEHAPDSDRQHKALMALGEGRTAEALDTLGELERLALADGILRLDYRCLTAEALLAAGRFAEAAAVPGRYPEPEGLTKYRVFYGGDVPELALNRARANEKLGRREVAVKELDALLSFWKEADDDLPLLVEAKAMRTRLLTTAR
jgi:tetratricopeptide (TPR) repeat protein